MSANKATLRASRSDQELEGEVDRFERYATVCGWGVVVGVIAEYVPRTIEFSNAGTLWTLHSAKELAGGILIAIGVAGEVLFSKMASLRQVQLSASKDEKVARLDAVAKQADLARVEIEKQLTETRRDIAEANTQAEGLRLDIAKANKEITEANERAAKAEQRAAEVNLELAKLKEPRTLLPEQQDIIISLMKPFAGQRFAFSVFPDPEALALLRIVDATLKAAGWQRIDSQIGDLVVNAAGATAGQSQDSGVQAFIAPQDTDAVSALRSLGASLTWAGIPCTLCTTDQLTGKTPKGITINIGKKPST
jgi:hypothetical protein